MDILSKRPTVKAPADTFTGDAWYDVIAKGEAPATPGTATASPRRRTSPEAARTDPDLWWGNHRDPPR
jgi:hypothetical protein